MATPDVNVTIQNNTVSNTSGAGIKVLHFNSNGNLRAKIVNNTVGGAGAAQPRHRHGERQLHRPGVQPDAVRPDLREPGYGLRPRRFR